MKNKRLWVLILALLVATAAVGCTAPTEQGIEGFRISVGPETPSDANNTSTEGKERLQPEEMDPTEFMSSNMLLAALEEYGSLTYVTKLYEEEELWVRIEGALTLENGHLRHSAEMRMTDILGDIMDYPKALYCGVVDEGTTGSLAIADIMSEEEAYKTLFIMTADEYEECIFSHWLADFVEWDTSVIESVKERKCDEAGIEGSTRCDSVLLISTADHLEDEDLTGESTYLLDAESGYVYSMENTIVYDDGYISRAVIDIAYGEQAEMSAEALDIVTSGEDTCQLKVVFNPGIEKEETQTHKIGKDTEVIPVSMKGTYGLYSDPSCTAEIDMIDLTEDAVTVYAKWSPEI